MEAPLPRVTLWRVLVEPYIPPEQTTGGLILSEGARQDSRTVTNFGRLIAIGEKAFSDPKFASTESPEVGDWVVFAAVSGVKLKMKNGRQLQIMNDDNILGVISDPELYENLV